MGYRTVVILNNDVAHEWSKDVGLGEKISAAANTISYNPASDKNEDFKFVYREGNFKYGKVVGVTHADVQQLMVLDSFDAYSVASQMWAQGKTLRQVKLKLLKQAAEELGYDLRAKSTKK